MNTQTTTTRPPTKEEIMREVKRWRKKEGLPVNGRFKNEPKWEKKKVKVGE